MRISRIFIIIYSYFIIIISLLNIKYSILPNKVKSKICRDYLKLSGIFYIFYSIKTYYI